MQSSLKLKSRKTSTERPITFDAVSSNQLPQNKIVEEIVKERRQASLKSEMILRRKDFKRIQQFKLNQQRNKFRLMAQNFTCCDLKSKYDSEEKSSKKDATIQEKQEKRLQTPLRNNLLEPIPLQGRKISRKAIIVTPSQVASPRNMINMSTTASAASKFVDQRKMIVRRLSCFSEPQSPNQSNYKKQKLSRLEEFPFPKTFQTPNKPLETIESQNQVTKHSVEAVVPPSPRLQLSYQAKEDFHSTVVKHQAY